MIEQLKIYHRNILALEVIECFTEADEQYLRKLFQEKLNNDFNAVNVLIKLDNGKLPKTHIKVFFEHLHFVSKNIKHINHLAIVAQSDTVKQLVFTIQNVVHTGDKRYFKLSEIEEAFNFIEEN